MKIGSERYFFILLIVKFFFLLSTTARRGLIELFSEFFRERQERERGEKNTRQQKQTIYSVDLWRSEYRVQTP